MKVIIECDDGTTFTLLASEAVSFFDCVNESRDPTRKIEDDILERLESKGYESDDALQRRWEARKYTMR